MYGTLNLFRAINRSREERHQQQQQMSSVSVEDGTDAGSTSSVRQQNATSIEEYGIDDGNTGGGEMITSAVSKAGPVNAALLAKQRKKSLMTRFIPGRN